jgi:hypothetical protein
MLERGDPVDVQVKTWSFNLLRNQKLNNAAVDDAAEAQVIIVAAQGEELPPAVEKWLEHWRIRPTNIHRASVVAVLDLPTQVNGHGSQLEEFLRSVATSTGSEFLLERAEEK